MSGISKMGFSWPLMKDNTTLLDRLRLAKFVLTTNRFTNGLKVRQFENTWSEWVGSKYSLYVSSGSTANYLLLAAVKELYNLKDGDKVLVPACTWITNVAPVIQLGFTPIFCDININNFSFCEDDLEYIAKVHTDIKLIFVTHLIGYSANNERYKNLFPNALILDDVCESHGCKNPDGTRRGSDSLGATFSFYFGHHISTVEGGMICTNNYELYDLMKIKRSHGLARESTRSSEYYDKYPDISNQFLFVTDGYNFRNHEICAVLGLSQLKRLDNIIQIRNRNFNNFITLVEEFSDLFYIPKYYSTTSNFCFPLICKEKEVADKLRKIFNEKNIEHRPIISGNLLRQPCLNGYGVTSNKKELMVDLVHDNGIYLGNNQFVGNRELKELYKIFKEL